MDLKSRSLSYDERKAAEAAFQGDTPDEKWSDSAKKIYIGMSIALARK